MLWLRGASEELLQLSRAAVTLPAMLTCGHVQASPVQQHGTTQRRLDALFPTDEELRFVQRVSTGTALALPSPACTMQARVPDLHSQACKRSASGAADPDMTVLRLTHRCGMQDIPVGGMQEWVAVGRPVSPGQAQSQPPDGRSSAQQAVRTATGVGFAACMQLGCLGLP